jgi:hypothetical protein
MPPLPQLQPAQDKLKLVPEPEHSDPMVEVPTYAHTCSIPILPPLPLRVLYQLVSPEK